MDIIHANPSQSEGICFNRLPFKWRKSLDRLTKQDNKIVILNTKLVKTN